MIYAYAIVDDPSLSVEGVRGVTDAPVVCIAQGPVAAVCSVHSSLDVTVDAATLRQHEQVTAALMTRCTVAPVRFCTVLADMDQLREILSTQGARLAAVLARLRGKVELAVRAREPAAGDSQSAGYSPAAKDARVVAPSSESPTSDHRPKGFAVSDDGRMSGRGYLRSLRLEHGDESAPALTGSLSHLHATLATRAVASTVKGHPDNSMVAAYLIDVGDVASFGGAVMAARAAYPRLRVSLTGPWAPFTFVEDGVLADV